jgi:hypothetical protein
LLVLGGLSCGLLGPVLLAMVFSLFNFTSVLFLGERAAKRKAPVIVAPVVQTQNS